ncbi:unnamed protein product [Trichogramma brassicae]|uniref:Uncharacterized protein n=1 Tax=Trichogramma brassicae TaxID=86971 RepID=A0A6H5ILE7_9HYME|nr:unnamed protein product [Trichogramma brassicae]
MKRKRKPQSTCLSASASPRTIITRALRLSSFSLPREKTSIRVHAYVYYVNICEMQQQRQLRRPLYVQLQPRSGVDALLELSTRKLGVLPRRRLKNATRLIRMIRNRLHPWVIRPRARVIRAAVTRRKCGTSDSSYNRAILDTSGRAHPLAPTLREFHRLRLTLRARFTSFCLQNLFKRLEKLVDVAKSSPTIAGIHPLLPIFPLRSLRTPRTFDFCAGQMNSATTCVVCSGVVRGAIGLARTRSKTSRGEKRLRSSPPATDQQPAPKLSRPTPRRILPHILSINTEMMNNQSSGTTQSGAARERVRTETFAPLVEREIGVGVFSRDGLSLFVVDETEVGDRVVTRALLDLAVATLSSALLAAADLVAPLSAPRPASRRKPWVTSQIRGLIRERDRVYRLFRRGGSSAAAYKELRSRVRNLLDTAKNRHLASRIAEAADMQSRWRALRSMGVFSPRLPSPLTSFSADELCSHYVCSPLLTGPDKGAETLALQRLQNACIRYIYGTIPRTAHVTPYRLALGWLSAEGRREVINCSLASRSSEMLRRAISEVCFPSSSECHRDRRIRQSARRPTPGALLQGAPHRVFHWIAHLAFSSAHSNQVNSLVITNILSPPPHSSPFTPPSLYSTRRRSGCGDAGRRALPLSHLN